MDTIGADNAHLSHGSKTGRHSGLPDRKAITAESQVFDVAFSGQLTGEERRDLGLVDGIVRRGATELCWHIRRGHKRRPPGLGGVADAVKSVKVRSAIVRADRAPKPGLPGGKINEV